jgi:hypothetical protein
MTNLNKKIDETVQMRVRRNSRARLNIRAARENITTVELVDRLSKQKPLKVKTLPGA